MSSFTFTFTWPAATKIAPLSLQMADDNLKARDPEGKSLIAVKLRNPGGKDRSIEFMALGPRENQMLSPTLVQFVWDYAKSGALVCPFSLMPKECSLALDFFGFGGLDIIVADEDPGKLAKNFSYAAFKNTMKAVPGIIEHVNRELSSNELAIGLHFIVSPPTPCWPQDTLMDFYKVTMPAGYKAIQLNCLPTTSSPRCFPESSYDILAPETENAADARGAVLDGVLALGTGIQAKWSKPRLKVCDVGEYGNHEFEYAKCYVLEVTVEPAGCDGAPSQGILSFVPEEDGQDAPKSKSKRKRKD